MMFIATGRVKYVGRTASVTWKDGRLTGDPSLIKMLQLEASIAKGREIGPIGGPYVTDNFLADPTATVILLNVILEDVQLEGDPFGERPPIPKGAIG